MRLPLAAAAAACLVLSAAPAAAQVFEVIHPDVDHGGFELEFLNGLALGGVPGGDERSAHEIALSYAPFAFWKTTFAVEIANPQNESAEVEAFEWENVFLLPFGGDHDHADDHAGGRGIEFGPVGIYAALEVPNEGGIGEGAAAIGPIAEMLIGPATVIGNLFLDIPFADDSDPGLSYAVSAAVPVTSYLALGGEFHGSAENLFGSSDESYQHFIGPAAYFTIDLGLDRVLEPRVAALFGLNDNSPDAVLSVNFELKF
jgi:hypothetical protein